MNLRSRVKRLLLTVVISCVSLQSHAEWLEEARDIMGTRVSVELWSEDVPAGRAAIEAVLADMQRIDLMMNPWNPEAKIPRSASHR